MFEAQPGKVDLGADGRLALVIVGRVAGGVVSLFVGEIGRNDLCICISICNSISEIDIDNNISI